MIIKKKKNQKTIIYVMDLWCPQMLTSVLWMRPGTKQCFLSLTFLPHQWFPTFLETQSSLDSWVCSCSYTSHMDYVTLVLKPELYLSTCCNFSGGKQCPDIFPSQALHTLAVNALHILTSLILTTVLSGKSIYLFHFIEGYQMHQGHSYHLSKVRQDM